MKMNPHLEKKTLMIACKRSSHVRIMAVGDKHDFGENQTMSETMKGIGVISLFYRQQRIKSV
jgi:hypothetical protein